MSIEVRTFENPDLAVGVHELTITTVARDSLDRVMCTDTKTVLLVVYESPSETTTFSPAFPTSNEEFTITTTLTDTGTITAPQTLTIPELDDQTRLTNFYKISERLVAQTPSIA